ncbi:MAG: glycoside hydrolase family 2 TIM barrel-domain containing protein [Bacteroidota bacterium]
MTSAKMILIGLYLLTSQLYGLSQNTTTSVRQRINFNSDWKFQLGDNPTYKDASFDDSNWRVLNLPHDWAIEGNFDKANPSKASGAFLPGGVGWYRKKFQVTDNMESKHVFIQFDGIYMNAEVWLNNQFLGRYPYGYTAIQYDLTGLLKNGQPNVLAVRVDNSLEPSARFYGGAGINRNVWLTTTNALHFDNTGGVFVSYKNVSEKAATIQYTYKIISNAFIGSDFQWWRANPALNNRITKQVTITTSIIDATGKIVASQKKVKAIRDYNDAIFKDELTIKDPKLWSSSNPVMYRLISKLEYDNKLIDDQVTAIGIRSIEYSTKKGMLVNGKQEKIKGVCLHQDAGSLGNAVPQGTWIYRLKKIKDMGANAIRCSHHPFAPEFYNICDSMGLYVMDEAFDEWNKGYGFTTENTSGKVKYGYHLYFDQWAETDLRSMIRRDRNHPSVIMYSIGNEIPNQQAFDGALLAAKLQNICHDEDPTRLVTAACDFINYANENGFLDTLDIAGYNYIGRFTGDKMYAPEKAKYPNRLYLGTETYYGVDYWLAVKNNDYVIGDFIWLGFDYLGEGMAWPKRGWDAGLIDMAGMEKPEYYLRKSYWSSDPVVHITVENGKNPQSEWHPKPTASHWNWKWNAGFLNNVFVYTNCEETELWVNNSRVGKKTVDKNLYYTKWAIPFSPGTIKAIGYIKGKKVAEHILQTADSAVGLNLVCNKKELVANGEDVAIIEVNVVDKNGVLVNDAQNQITVQVEGNAVIKGLDNGDQYSHVTYNNQLQQAYHGRILATLQTTNLGGKIIVTFAGKGLKPASITFLSK